MGREALARVVVMMVVGGFVMNVLVGVHGMGVDGNGMDLLLDDVWYVHLVGNFVGRQDFDFLHNRHFHHLDFLNLFCVMFMDGVMRILDFDVPVKS